MKRKLSIVMLLGMFVTFENCKDEEPVDASFKITAITPESGTAGSAVAITGVGFSNIASENIVKFNGVEAVVVNADENALAVIVPATATTGELTVTTAGKTATGPAFTVTEPTATKTYYIQFKVAGVTKVFEAANPGYQSCGQCACSYMPVLSENHYAGIDVCNDNSDWILASDIQGWDGDKIPFTSANFPVASFNFADGGTSFSTDGAQDQTGSELSITDVVADGTFNGKKMFKVTGNFKCKVAQSGGTTLNVTDGTFVIRYSED